LNLWIGVASCVVSEGELPYEVERNTNHFGSGRRGINWRHLDDETEVRVSDLIVDQSGCTLSSEYGRGQLFLMLLI
jgi:hypothetical protein